MFLICNFKKNALNIKAIINMKEILNNCSLTFMHKEVSYCI